MLVLMDSGIKGVQVHDARLITWVKAQIVSHVMTPNGSDFVRYPGIVVLAPDDVLAGKFSSPQS